MASVDRSVSIVVSGNLSDQMPSSSCFSTLEEASTFFQGGSLGYSVTTNEKRLDGLILHTEKWEIQPLEVQEVHSSYFSDESRFPKGSVQFDCALLMRNVPHEWHGTEDMYI